MLRKFLRRDPGPLPMGPAETRLYAIGDVHGRYDLLARVADRIADDVRSWTGASLTVLLGDLADRGPDTRKVIDMVNRGNFPTAVITLMGDHERAMLDARESDEAFDRWRSMGGNETLASYVDLRRFMMGEELRQLFIECVPEAHIAFLEELSFSYSAGDYFFCHAGVRPGIALDRQNPDDLLWIREPFLSSTRHHGKMVVHGHTPVSVPGFYPNRINLDTGAYATGQLTCLVIEGEQQRLIASE